MYTTFGFRVTTNNPDHRSGVGSIRLHMGLYLAGRVWAAQPERESTGNAVPLPSTTFRYIGSSFNLF